MSDDILENFLKDALPLLRQFCIGEYGISLGGSCAKGISDEQSDIDIYRRIRELVYPGNDGSIEYLRTQREALGRLVTDVERLVNGDNKPT